MVQKSGDHHLGDPTSPSGVGHPIIPPHAMRYASHGRVLKVGRCIQEETGSYIQ